MGPSLLRRRPLARLSAQAVRVISFEYRWASGVGLGQANKDLFGGLLIGHRNQAVDLLGDAAEVVADLLQQVFTLRKELPNLAATVDGGAFHFHQPSFAES